MNRAPGCFDSTASATEDHSGPSVDVRSSIANGYEAETSRDSQGRPRIDRRHSGGIKIKVGQRFTSNRIVKRYSSIACVSFNFCGKCMISMKKNIRTILPYSLRVQQTVDVRTLEANCNLTEAGSRLEVCIVGIDCRKTGGPEICYPRPCGPLIGPLTSGLCRPNYKSSSRRDEIGIVVSKFTLDVRWLESDCHQSLTCWGLKFCTSLKNRGHTGSTAVKRGMTNRDSWRQVCIFVLDVG